MNLDKIYEAMYKLNMALHDQTGESDPLVSISVHPEIFNTMVIEAHRKGPRFEIGQKIESSFRPSDAHFFQVMGVRIRPEYKN